MLVRRLHRLQASQVEKIRSKMMRAGLRSREAVGIYAGIKLASPMLFGFSTFVLLYGANIGHIPLAYRPLALIGASLFGFFGRTSTWQMPRPSGAKRCRNLYPMAWTFWLSVPRPA